MKLNYKKNCKQCFFVEITKDESKSDISNINRCTCLEAMKDIQNFKIIYEDCDEMLSEGIIANICEYFLPDVSSLTDKQEAIFGFIKNHIQKVGYPPSYSEVADAFEFSSRKTVLDYFRVLERKNFITCSSKPRAVCLTGYKIRIESKGSMNRE